MNKSEDHLGPSSQEIKAWLNIYVCTRGGERVEIRDPEDIIPGCGDCQTVNAHRFEYQPPCTLE